ncbi:hypothetical protein LWI28_021672 [Acer negundo]|uniref:40S ribosomal protein S7 n=1 Tax=Acer negundo TaxID=4023 RepID=A0AAD5NPV8_ACENE|nr:hypothetical protein LWI28_021672 [Acer negundo]
MFSSKKKIQKDKDAEPTEFEESVAQALFDLENTNQELKSDLKDLYINSAMQIDVSGNRKAVVVHVPYRLRKAYRKIHVRLVRELEKKFSGKDVILIATRRIVRPPKKGSAVQRPRTRTLTAVHEAMLEDIVLPAEIVGKRVRYRLDGSKIMKVFLDPKERNNTEYKMDTFAAVYRKLSGKDVVFEFPITEGSNDGEELVESDYEQEVEDITPETCLDPTNFWDILQVQDVLPAECGSRSDYVDGSEDLSSFDGYDGEEDEGVQPRKFIKTRYYEFTPNRDMQNQCLG